MNELEETIIAKLLAGDDPRLAVLRQHVLAASVVSREFSGVGFLTTIAVPSGASRLEVDRMVIGDVYAELEGLGHEAGFLLFVADGAVRTLECFIVDGEFPASPRIKRAYYVRPAAGNPGSLVETSTRDLDWALRDRAA